MAADGFAERVRSTTLDAAETNLRIVTVGIYAGRQIKTTTHSITKPSVPK